MAIFIGGGISVGGGIVIDGDVAPPTLPPIFATEGLVQNFITEPGSGAISLTEEIQ